MSRRNEDSVWLYFDQIKVVGKAGCRTTCKKCGKEMQGLVARMRQHYDSCTDAHTVDTSTTHTELIHSVSPLTWWESQKGRFDNSMLTFCR